MLSTFLWFFFIAFVLTAILLDLFFFHKKGDPISVRKSVIITSGWVISALMFCLIIYFAYGYKSALEFATGYVIELSLSVDNVFVFMFIFSYFQVPIKYQYRVLFWGVLGAIIMRFCMIALGVALISKFEFLFYIFGLFLIYTGYKMWRHHGQKQSIDENKVTQFISQFIRVSNKLHGEKFFVKLRGAWHATPLFIVLLFVEKSDLVFALDSIPAIIAITQDPFIVYTANIFAILGLRSLYFLIANLVLQFKYLHYALSFILVFVGVKMTLIPSDIHVPTLISLFIIISAISISILFSVKNNLDKKKAKIK